MNTLIIKLDATDDVVRITPLLTEFFFKYGMDECATSAISVEEVFNAVLEQLK
jgi:hypothetical protein